MPAQTIDRLKYLCDTIPALWNQLSEEELCHRPAPGKWSKKEVLGHLIDSATNNHQRFIRAQFEQQPTIVYDQDNWNANSYYQLHDSKQLLSFWTGYNRHLAELFIHIPAGKLAKECKTSGGESHTLTWLFDDYVQHLEHHLKQILTY